MSATHRVAFSLLASLLVGCEHDPLPGTGGNAFRTSAYVGEWTGTWTNTTNNTSGAASFVVVDSGSDTLTLAVDLGGNVFGAGDPVAESFVLGVGSSAAVLTPQTTPTYGSLNGRLEADGTVTADAVNLAIGNVRTFRLEGQWRSNEIDLELTLTYVTGSTPETGRSVLRLTKR